MAIGKPNPRGKKLDKQPGSGPRFGSPLVYVLLLLVGFLLASRLPAWVTVFLLIATEVILLALIRDNLTLNVIMLIHPVEWIKQWQMAK